MAERNEYPAELVACEKLGTRLRQAVEEANGPIEEVKFHMLYGSEKLLNVNDAQQSMAAQAIGQMSTGASLATGITAPDFWIEFVDGHIGKRWKARTTTLAFMRGFFNPQGVRQQQ